MASLGDFLNSINYNKNDLFKQDPLNEKDYVPYIINKGMSYFQDTVILANEMNKHPDIPKACQYRFLKQTVRARKRFSKWHKKIDDDSIDAIKQYYNYSTQKAEQVIKILTPQQIDIIKQQLEVGGLGKSKKKK